MEFSGERYTPEISGAIRLEHIQRYGLSLSIARNSIVADIACGEGYGSALLSSVAKIVSAIDISGEAISHAMARYSGYHNINFTKASAICTGLQSETHDLVVSFETIEHLLEQDEMLAEFCRVLKPDGILLISSPNRPVYSYGKPVNEYHVKELDFSEFDSLLKKYFSKIKYYGQRLAIGAVIQSLDGQEALYKASRDDEATLSEGAPVLCDPVYYIALCGNGDQDLPDLPASILYPQKTDLLDYYVGLAKWAKNQDIEIEKRDEYVAHYRKEIATLTDQRDLIRTEIIRAEAQLELLKEIFLSNPSQYNNEDL